MRVFNCRLKERAKQAPRSEHQQAHMKPYHFFPCVRGKALAGASEIFSRRYV